MRLSYQILLKSTPLPYWLDPPLATTMVKLYKCDYNICSKPRRECNFDYNVNVPPF